MTRRTKRAARKSRCPNGARAFSLRCRTISWALCAFASFLMYSMFSGALAGCRRGGGSGDASGGPSDVEGEVVIYVAHDLVHSGPVLRSFEQRTGIRVRVVGDTEANKTTGLATRLLSLKERPEADVYWNNEVMRTVQLADEGVLQSFVPASAVGIPPRHCDPAGRWVGFAARARVLLVHTRLLGEEEPPRSIFDLAAPRYQGKVAMANPLFGTTATHVAALFEHLGPERAKELLLALKANDVRVVGGNAMARNLVRDGELPLCLTDTDDANGAILSGAPVRMIYLDQEEDGLGTLVIPNTLALVRGCPHPREGRQLMEFLGSREVEERLVRSSAAQMPLREGIAPHSPLYDLRRIREMAVDWERVASRATESARFIEEAFLR